MAELFQTIAQLAEQQEIKFDIVADQQVNDAMHTEYAAR